MDATHTKDLDSQHSKIPKVDLTVPVRHPVFVMQDVDADAFTASRMFNPEKLIVRMFRRAIKVLLK